MPDNNQTNTPLTNNVQAPNVPTSNPADGSSAPAGSNPKNPATKQSSTEIMNKVAEKIADAHNILVALSSDPSVDELATAIGLTLCLDKLGKRATAIYSGMTPNALEFLKPEEAFDTSADTLQDFVIALNKEKADHLRYKLDGEYVKIFITPYRSRIAEEDLEFSYGDFNIDLVLALDVANGVDLDSALREHGRIMHDAAIVNITTGNPGKFGEIEWSDKSASSVAEMVSHLLYEMIGKAKIAPEEATALLTGIVAATERFSRGNTTAETMRVASRLMESGADQQLIAKNITVDVNNQIFNLSLPEETKDDDSIDILHGEEENGEENEEENREEDDSKSKESSEDEAKSEPESDVEAEKAPEPEIDPEKDPLLAELKATEASLANAGAETTPESKNEPVRLDGVNETTDLPSEFGPEKVIAPPEDFAAEASGESMNRYGQMLEDALAESNPAASAVPDVASAPEINGVPDINYMPFPDDQVLPPPPAPPLDFNNSASAAPIEPAGLATPEAPTSLGAQPAMQDQVYRPQASAPDAFKIPGLPQ